MTPSSELLTFLNIIAVVITVCVVIGGFSGFRNGRQTKLMELQEKTIIALQGRVKTLEDKAIDLERENAVQQHLIDTLISAYKQEGRTVTIDGDLITIQDKTGARITHRKRVITQQHPSANAIKKEEA